MSTRQPGKTAPPLTCLNGGRESDRTPNGMNGVIGIVASAGGVTAVSHVLANLPADFPLPILLLQHVGQQSRLVEILQTRCALSVQWASSGLRLRTASVYVTPPECTLKAEGDGTLFVFPMASPLHFQLAADQLLASMACYRHRALAVVLTGTGRGGSLGVQEVKQQGGVVFAQDEASSLHWDMPRAAIEMGCVDLVLPLHQIAPALVSTVRNG